MGPLHLLLVLIVLSSGKDRSATGEERLQLGVKVEPLGHLEKLLVQILQLIKRHGRLDVSRRAGVPHPSRGPAGLQPRGMRCLRRHFKLLLLEGTADLLKPLHRLLVHGVDLFLADNSTLDQLLGIHVSHPGVLRDVGVHHRLGEGGLVTLVVTESPVSDQVDQHVLTEAIQ